MLRNHPTQSFQVSISLSKDPRNTHQGSSCRLKCVGIRLEACPTRLETDLKADRLCGLREVGYELMGVIDYGVSRCLPAGI